MTFRQLFAKISSLYDAEVRVIDLIKSLVVRGFSVFFAAFMDNRNLVHDFLRVKFVLLIFRGFDLMSSVRSGSMINRLFKIF